MDRVWLVLLSCLCFGLRLVLCQRNSVTIYDEKDRVSAALQLGLRSIARAVLVLRSTLRAVLVPRSIVTVLLVLWYTVSAMLVVTVHNKDSVSATVYS